MSKSTKTPQPAIHLKFTNDDAGRQLKDKIGERANHHGITTQAYLKLLALAEFDGQPFSRRLAQFKRGQL